MQNCSGQLLRLCFSSWTFLPKPPAVSRSGITCVHHPVRRARKNTIANLEIQSLKNPRVKDARALLRRRHREKEGKILLEGQRLITDALEAGIAPRDFFYTKEALERSDVNCSLRLSILNKGAEGFLVSENVIRSLSDTVNPQGLVAIFDRPHVALPASPTLTLICDEIRDPGNLGTLLRSAAGAGVHAVILTTGCADVWGLKALRSGMGAQFRLPVETGKSWADIVSYLETTRSVLRVADATADVSYADVDWSVPSALVVGSEAEGPSDEAVRAAQEKVAIPLAEGVESLNAAMAGSIILFEARRQRGKGYE